MLDKYKLSFFPRKTFLKQLLSRQFDTSCENSLMNEIISELSETGKKV